METVIVCVMDRPVVLLLLPPRGWAAALAVAVLLVLAGCSSTSDRPSDAGASTGPGAAARSSAVPAACPTQPVNVVVSVDQWGDIVSQLGGS